MFKNRDTYRNLCRRDDLVSYRVTVKETDLFVMTTDYFENETRDIVLKHRGHLEAYIEKNPSFATTLVPWPADPFAPPMVRAMMDAGIKAGVGPMAAVAGSVSEFVGMDMADLSKDIIIENGGDIFARITKPLVVGLFAGKSPLTGKIGLKFAAGRTFGICTSSGTVGHSLSFGRADAVCVVSDSCSLSDAAATAIGNLVKKSSDIQPAIDFGRGICGVKGLLIVVGKHMGLWGEMEIAPL